MMKPNGVSIMKRESNGIKNEQFNSLEVIVIPSLFLCCVYFGIFLKSNNSFY